MPCNNLQTSIGALTSHNAGDYEKIFYDSANDIMNNYNLVINGSTFELVELEYYFNDCNDKKMHDDPYVHCKLLQQQCNKLYVHQKAFGRTGIDITFGNGAYYGGILIRGVLVGSTFTNGTANIATLIANSAQLTPPTTHEELQTYLNQQNIGLIRKQSSNQVVLRYFRIGLNLKACDYFKQDKYISRLYRFIRKDASKERGQQAIKQKTEVEKLNERLSGQGNSLNCCLPDCC